MKSRFLSTLTFLAMMHLGATAMAQDSIGHSTQASGHSTQASKHSALASRDAVAGTAAWATGIAAIPLLSVGMAGVASIDAADRLMSGGSPGIGEPLEIADETYVRSPSPSEAMQP